MDIDFDKAQSDAKRITKGEKLDSDAQQNLAHAYLDLLKDSKEQDKVFEKIAKLLHGY